MADRRDIEFRRNRIVEPARVDIEFRRNRICRPSGQWAWTVKSTLELRIGRRVLIEQNTFVEPPPEGLTQPMP